MEANNEYPMIVVQVPHQMPVWAGVIENEKQLYTLAQNEGGDNWEFPGHYENPDNENDPGNWVDETTVEDLKEAIEHDMHQCLFITKEDWIAGVNFGSHQGIQARNAARKCASELDWPHTRKIHKEMNYMTLVDQLECAFVDIFSEWNVKDYERNDYTLHSVTCMEGYHDWYMIVLSAI